MLSGIAVIFLPGFFKQHAPYQVDTRSQIPPRPNITPVVIDKPQPSTVTAPAPEPSTMFLPDNEQPVLEPESEEMSASSATSTAAVTTSLAADVETEGAAVEPESEAEVEAAPEDDASASLLADAWMVQVASLRSSESAQSLRKRLQERGYKAYVRSAKTSQGEVSRVFIGPKLDKALALEVKQEVDPVFKVNSMVLPFKP